MKRELTARQREIYTFVRDEILRKGRPPTYREIGERFGIRSPNGVKRSLDALFKKGYLIREPRVSRGIALPESTAPVLGEAVREIPVIGRVAAGSPIVAEENWESTVHVDASLFRGEGYFALRVKGDSMKNVGIFDNDIVIARQQSTAQKGDIVVAILGEEATVKRYVPLNGEILLVPENEDYEPIRVSRDDQDFRIVGKVTGLLRKL